MLLVPCSHSKNGKKKENPTIPLPLLTMCALLPSLCKSSLLQMNVALRGTAHKHGGIQRGPRATERNFSKFFYTAPPESKYQPSTNNQTQCWGTFFCQDDDAHTHTHTPGAFRRRGEFIHSLLKKTVHPPLGPGRRQLAFRRKKRSTQHHSKQQQQPVMQRAQKRTNKQRSPPRSVRLLLAQ